VQMAQKVCSRDGKTIAVVRPLFSSLPAEAAA
jgi:hypothetical protein